MIPVEDEVVAFLRACDRQQIAITRHGNRLRLKGPAAIPPALLECARQLKPRLLRVVPDAEPRVAVHFRLPGHPANGWATAIGRPCESRAELVADLRRRWPDVEVLP